MRIICDTNLLISGVLFKGNPRSILRLASEGRIENCISPEILQEAEEVLRRPKFGLAPEDVSAILETFQHTFTLVVPTTRVNIIKEDPDDNIILEAALAAQASCVVSGDSHLLAIHSWRGIRIVSPSEFLKTILR